MRRLFLSLLACLSPLAAAQAQTSPTLQNSAHAFTFIGIDGTPLPLANYEGKVLLIVNTASQCGFTKQYAGLEALYQKYKDRGLVVIGVPCNQFGKQEPGSETDIKKFAQEAYGITFPLTQKTDVSGEFVHPFFAWAEKQDTDAWLFSKPRWNFHKYLIGTNGALIGSFGSQVEPESEKIIAAIEAALPAN